MWNQHLFSKRMRDPNGGLDEFHVLTKADKADYVATKRILGRSRQTSNPNSIFIVDYGNRWYVGADGFVKDVLDKHCPYGYENGDEDDREISFIHGFFSSKSTPIPDFDEIISKQPKLLEEILRQANEQADKVIPIAVNFTIPRKAGTEWDKIAREFESGKRAGQGATFTREGKLFQVLEKAKPEIGEAGDGTQKKTLAPTNMPNVGFLKVATVAILAIVTLVGSWKLLKHFKDNQSEKSNQTIRTK